MDKTQPKVEEKETEKKPEEQPEIKPDNTIDNKDNEKKENGYEELKEKFDKLSNDYSKMAELLNEKFNALNKSISNITLKSGAAIHEDIKGEPKLPNGELYKKVDELDI